MLADIVISTLDVEFCAWGLFRRLRDPQWDRSARASFVRWPLQCCMLADIAISTFWKLDSVHRASSGASVILNGTGPRALPLCGGRCRVACWQTSSFQLFGS